MRILRAFFFFSSRRRHTRLQGDWSSDVCSSDLVPRSTRCVAGQSWDWDGVTFAVLHPGPIATPAKPNDESCVIRISTRAGAMLLTGDIEARSESGLLGRETQLDADLLLVPHHGSRTSSTPAFLVS